MSDKAWVQSAPGGERYFVVEREERRMPVLNGRGDIDFWDLKTDNMADFRRMLDAMDHPERLKDVTPEKTGPGWGYGEF